MSAKKAKLRKTPLTCLPDLDALDNCEKQHEDEPEVKLPFKKRAIEKGKENHKSHSASKAAQKPARQTSSSVADSDSDSDFYELCRSLKKTGVRTGSKSKAASLSKTGKANSPSQTLTAGTSCDKKEARKQLFVEELPSDRLLEVRKSFNEELLKATRTTNNEIKNSPKASPKIKASAQKRRGKRAHSEESESNGSLPHVTPLKRRKQAHVEKTESPVEKESKSGALDTLIASTERTIDIIRQLRRDSEKTPGRAKAKRAPSADPEDEASYSTPLKKRKSARKELPTTPVSHIIKKCDTPRTPLEEARMSLHVSAVPNSLPCREMEYQNILSFVENKVMDGVGGCMYISGVPGTGKTATVSQVIRQLQATSKAGNLPAFKYIEINGMRLSDPRQAYVLLYQQIFDQNERISSDSAHKKLDAYFNKSDKKKMTTVILVDELDLMCTRKQDVVYNLLDWPSKPSSRLVVLTIANTMDMPERKLKGRVNSRLGLTRLTFLPYTHKQLEEIVLARLQGTDAFVLDAVRLATRKVAAVSGDARRALDICRRAAELPADDEPVRITHIEQAIKEMTNSNIVRLIRSCSEVEKIFLRSVSDVCVRTGLEEVDLLQVMDHLLPLCVLEGLQRPPVPAVLAVCHRLKCFRLLFTSSNRAGLLQRLTLNLTQDDLHYAFKAEA